MVERDKDLDFRPIIFVSLTRYVYLYPNARNFLYPLREEERLAGEALRSFVWAFCEQRARGGKVDGGDNGGSSSPNDNHFASRANFETISGSKVGDSVAKYRCAQVSFRFCQEERAIVPSLV